MNEAIVSALIAGVFTVIGIIIGIGGSYFIQKRKSKEDRTLKLLEIQIQRLDRVLSKGGFDQFLNFFEEEDYKALMELLRRTVKLSENYEGQAEKLDRIFRLLESTLFNPVTGRIHTKIEENDLFIERLDTHRDSKEALASGLIGQELIKDILRDTKSIFIESGSTLAYFMLSIIKDIKNLRPDCETNPLIVCTNNIGIYIILLFEEHFEPILLPGKPNNQYGATFADALGTGKQNDGERVRKFLEDHEVSALFTTASYIDFKYGPHVSSRRNHAVKRIFNQYANDKNIPNILIIAAEKINDDVIQGNVSQNCRLIFDHRCIAYKEETKENLEEAKNQWEVQLRKCNNYIITGSNLEKETKRTMEAFRLEHPYLRIFDQVHRSGITVKINCP